MREYGITFDGATGLPEGHYVLHRKDGLSLPTVFGSFDSGRCGPIEGQAATRLCMAMGHELSKVERFCMRTAEVTQVWPAPGDPPQPKTLEQELATLPDGPELAELRLDPGAPLVAGDAGPNISADAPAGSAPVSETLVTPPIGPASIEPVVADPASAKPKGKKKG